MNDHFSVKSQPTPVNHKFTAANQGKEGTEFICTCNLFFSVYHPYIFGLNKQNN